jgi:hypothetical protein
MFEKIMKCLVIGVMSIGLCFFISLLIAFWKFGILGG